MNMYLEPTKNILSNLNSLFLRAKNKQKKKKKTQQQKTLLGYGTFDKLIIKS